MTVSADGLGPFRSMVAVGDSFTEGMCDEVLGDGEYRGWADRVAERLAAQAGGGFRYANLAVRGKLIGQIVDQQVDRAASLGGELVTLAGGLNDVLRPGCDVEAVCAQLGEAAGKLASGARLLVLFHSTDPSRRMAGGSRVLPAILRLKRFVSELAEQPGVVVVELFDAPCFDDPRLWAEDRLHLSPEGHRRVAEAVLQAVGQPPEFDWRAPLPPVPPPGRARRLADDLRWLGRHLGPWVMRRIRGTSSGDGRSPKRPELLPYP
ncbi:SGNH/GDSL hydrolase family protein [Streptacidiphilus sp. PB12-B1b]|uniref:SGNH/GDSL hydrolase family protein n=1 Tax=Streptacidiphilus sp. PB12-B1b TaxID=2705012 RepID=UPI0015F8732B|nr:SGNH/GDSL hydrolase family protein [Streptacidiphilus sp. PB12-B1b]QMU76225.1 SGNH/GDSL hydrolase family protein [Streptacidiphilus sp. PB12-B1b]